MTTEEAKRVAERAIAAAIAEYEARTGATVQRIEVAHPPTSGPGHGHTSSTRLEEALPSFIRSEFGTGPKWTRACIAASPRFLVLLE